MHRSRLAALLAAPLVVLAIGLTACGQGPVDSGSIEATATTPSLDAVAAKQAKQKREADRYLAQKHRDAAHRRSIERMLLTQRMTDPMLYAQGISNDKSLKNLFAVDHVDVTHGAVTVYTNLYGKSDSAYLFEGLCNLVKPDGVYEFSWMTSLRITDQDAKGKEFWTEGNERCYDSAFESGLNS